MKITTSTIWSVAVSLLTVVGLSGCNKVNELIVTPKVNSVPMGFELQLKAEKLYKTGLVVDVTSADEISWSSSDESIASVDSNGLVSAKSSAGSVTVTASGTFNGIEFKDSATVEVTDAEITSVSVEPKSAEIPVGFTKAFSASAAFTDGQSLNITNYLSTDWSSSNPYVATVTNTGGEKGIAEGGLTGTTSITASILGYSDDAELEISDATITSFSILPKQESMPIGLIQAFSAVITLSNGDSIDVTNDDRITWVSSNRNIAIVSNDAPNKGVAKGVGLGSVEISASGSFNGQQVNDAVVFEVGSEVAISLEVLPESKTIPVGMTASYKALVTFSDGMVLDITDDSSVSWSSSNSDRATVSNSEVDKGTVTALELGKVGITAFAEINGRTITDTAALEVVESIVVDLQVSPKPQNSLDTPQIPVGYTKQFTAEAVLSDGALVDVTDADNLNWSSDNTSVATISNNPENKGFATAIEVGTSYVTAELVTDIGTLQDQSELTVTPLHTLSFDVATEKFTNTVQGESIHYIGYVRRVMGRYSVLNGERFLNSSMQMIYIDGGEGKAIEEHTFYFAQVDEEPISGALQYKAVFEWPDGTVTEGALEWDFEQNHYTLVDPSAAKNLLEEEWDFKLTVTNEEDF